MDDFWRVICGGQVNDSLSFHDVWSNTHLSVRDSTHTVNTHRLIVLWGQYFGVFIILRVVNYINGKLGGC